MTTKQAWILAGVAAAVLAVGYLATQREVHATIDVGEGLSVTYHSSDGGAEGASGPIVDSHQRMMELIERSEQAIRDYDADATNPQP